MNSWVLFADRHLVAIDNDLHCTAVCVCAAHSRVLFFFLFSLIPLSAVCASASISPVDNSFKFNTLTHLPCHLLLIFRFSLYLSLDCSFDYRETQMLKRVLCLVETDLLASTRWAHSFPSRQITNVNFILPGSSSPSTTTHAIFWLCSLSPNSFRLLFEMHLLWPVVSMNSTHTLIPESRQKQADNDPQRCRKYVVWFWVKRRIMSSNACMMNMHECNNQVNYSYDMHRNWSQHQYICAYNVWCMSQMKNTTQKMREKKNHRIA